MDRRARGGGARARDGGRMGEAVCCRSWVGRPGGGIDGPQSLHGCVVTDGKTGLVRGVLRHQRAEAYG